MGIFDPMLASNLEFSPMSAVSVLLGLQFAAFGWRINREIAVGDAGRKVWLPLPDLINIASMLCVVLLCVVLPLSTSQFGVVSRTMMTVAFVLISLHPISMCGHYRLFLPGGRHVYTLAGKDYPYITKPELFIVVMQLALAAVSGWYVATK
jgi:hypothetical protein